MAHTDDSQFEVAIVKGERIDIDFLIPCIALDPECRPEQLRVSHQPTEGILFETGQAGVWAYQHAGTSTDSDRIEVEHSPDGRHYEVFAATITIGRSYAAVEVLTPLPGSTITGDSVDVSYRISGQGYDHLHLEIQVEGQAADSSMTSQISLYEPVGIHRFESLMPGSYQITATLARSNHQQIANSQRAVTFNLSAVP